MSFQIKPNREFLCDRPLPPALSRMSELAYNIVWSWEPIVRALFRRLDPRNGVNRDTTGSAAWGVSQSTLDRRRRRSAVSRLYGQAASAYDEQIQTPSPAPATL